jgi:hypothetical protein
LAKPSARQRSNVATLTPTSRDTTSIAELSGGNSRATIRSLYACPYRAQRALCQESRRLNRIETYGGAGRSAVLIFGMTRCALENMGWFGCPSGSLRRWAGERQQVEDREHSRKVLPAVAEVVLEVVAFRFRDIEAFVVSRPEEFHLRPLAEPCVRLSPHTAPVGRTRRQYLFANVRRDTGSSVRWSRGRCLPVSYDQRGVCISA